MILPLESSYTISASINPSEASATPVSSSRYTSCAVPAVPITELSIPAYTVFLSVFNKATGGKFLGSKKGTNLV
jgi:hypothetical protein